MSILNEIKSEILENRELDSNEKLCLVALLCSDQVHDISALAELMGATYNTAQMAVRSLRLKGYLQNSDIGANEEELEALYSLLKREESERAMDASDMAASGLGASALGEYGRGTPAVGASGQGASALGPERSEYGPRVGKEPTVGERFGKEPPAAAPGYDPDVAGYAEERRNVARTGSAGRGAGDAPGVAPVPEKVGEAYDARELAETLGVGVGAGKGSLRSRAAALYKKDSMTAKGAARASAAFKDYGKDGGVSLDTGSARGLASSTGGSGGMARGSASSAGGSGGSGSVAGGSSSPTGGSGGSSGSEGDRSARTQGSKSGADPVMERVQQAATKPGARPRGRSKTRAADDIAPEDKVMHMMEEAITRSEAAIILGFAGGDLDRVERVYNRVRGTQIKDKVDALVKLLQLEDEE